MTKEIAYKILGLTPGTDFTEIKKKYRQLMHRVHPDTEAFSTSAYDFTAQEINEASKQMKWNAPLNKNAYTTRTVYSGTFPENINLQIEGLLKEYEKNNF